MQAEYDSLMDNDTWTLVEKPEDQQVLPGKHRKNLLKKQIQDES